MSARPQDWKVGTCVPHICLSRPRQEVGTVMLPDSLGCTERSCGGLGAIMGLNIKGFVEHVSRSTRFTWSERK